MNADQNTWRPSAARRVLVGSLLVVGLFACGQPSTLRPPTPQPNVVLIISDDQGFPDFGFTGSPLVETPNLDRLAAEGVYFPLAFNTASVCQKSLLTLLSGLEPIQWAYRSVVRTIEQPDFDPMFTAEHVETLPRLLARAGYASFQAGKHWEGSFETAGFTAGMRTTTREAAYLREVVHFGRRGLAPVVEFLDDVGEDPFFLWFAPQMPHRPHDPPARLIERYADVALPASRRYYAMCTWFDEVVGELLEQLEQRGLRDETIVLFVSDNGFDGVGGTMGGRKSKSSLYDLGFRTPLLVSWPGVIERGKVVDALVSTADVVPTVLDYTGQEAPAVLRGRSLRGLIEGNAGPLRDAVVSSQFVVRRARPRARAGETEKPADPDDGYAVRTLGWRYHLRRATGEERLYDLSVDPREEADLAAEKREVAAAMRVRVDAWIDAVSGPVEAELAAVEARDPEGAAIVRRCLSKRVHPEACREQLRKRATDG